MPIMSKNVGYSYSRRHGGCRLIPLTEMGWFITKTSANKEKWFCGACSGEFKLSTNVKGTIDALGHTEDYSYVIFMSMPFGHGRETLLANGLPPSKAQEMQLRALRLITAKYACDSERGATASVLQMMVASNEAFNAMAKGFPKREVMLI